MGCSSKQEAHRLWIKCSRDLLFYLNAFGWTYDPRCTPPALPFITWEYQDEAALAIDDAIGRSDLLIEKSRDMGASWLVLAVFEWRWHFRPLQTFLLASRKEDYVDKSDDPDSLMWKIDFLHKCQPRWLLPNITRNKLLLYNRHTDSTIAGDSTTGDLGRGGRRTAIFLDEFAAVDNGYEVLHSTADTSPCRIFASTPKGTGNAFYDRKQAGTKSFAFHWSRHPKKAEGLYKDENGKWRSPWYDQECKRRANPMEVAQELDIDYLGSDYQFFDAVVMDQYEREFARPALLCGDVEYSKGDWNTTFRQLDRGPLLLWAQPDLRNEWPKDRDYVLAVDVATGSRDATGRGASNSCISIGDTKTREKIGEFTMSGIEPTDLADRALALAHWFKGQSGEGAFIIWEANGPGRLFGSRIISHGYRKVYFRTKENSLAKKVSDVPGWFTLKENKLDLLGEYRRSLASREFINRSREALRETRYYVHVLNSGVVAHSSSISTIDPTGARDNHGDRVIADALLWHIMKIGQAVTPASEEIPMGSYEHRRIQFRKTRDSEKLW